jgi:predicted nuclease with TOPRIM domain
MELVTSRWTDDRMDDLKHQVDELGRRMEEGFAEQRREMNARFDRLEARFEKVNERFEKVDAKFEAIHDQITRTQEMVIGLHATLTRFSLGFLGAALVAVIAAILTRGS